MNRRDFFKLAAAAPVALPLAAKAFASQASIHGELMAFEFVGIDGAAIGPIKSWSPTQMPNARMMTLESQQMAATIIADNDMPLSVEDQMAEHGLFDDATRSRPFREGGGE